MASPLSTSSLFSPSSYRIKSATFAFVPHPNNTKVSLTPWLCQLGQVHFPQWSGLKHLGLGVSIRPKSLRLERRKKNCRGLVIHASLFGVGAPEALVIGVVALLVFGPKGLAEVARNLGKTLRAFQPTIRELQDVSKEFKSTLEREIGLDDISTSGQNRYDSYKSNGSPTPPPASPSEDTSGITTDPNVDSSSKRAYTSEEYLKRTEEQLKASAVQQQGQTPTPVETQNGAETQPVTPAEIQRGTGAQSKSEEGAAAVSPSQKPETEA